MSRYVYREKLLYIMFLFFFYKLYVFGEFGSMMQLTVIYGILPIYQVQFLDSEVHNDYFVKMKSL